MHVDARHQQRGYDNSSPDIRPRELKIINVNLRNCPFTQNVLGRFTQNFGVYLLKKLWVLRTKLNARFYFYPPI